MLQQHASLHGQESLRVIKKEMIENLVQLVFPVGEDGALPSRNTHALELVRHTTIPKSQ